MQETDFPATDGFAPLDPPILLGLDPVFLIGLILLVLALAAAMYLFGRRSGGQDRGSDDAPAQIHADILKLSRAAMAAEMETSRAQLNRVLDPEASNVTLDTLSRAARVLGHSLRVELV